MTPDARVELGTRLGILSEDEAWAPLLTVPDRDGKPQPRPWLDIRGDWTPAPDRIPLAWHAWRIEAEALLSTRPEAATTESALPPPLPRPVVLLVTGTRDAKPGAVAPHLTEWWARTADRGHRRCDLLVIQGGAPGVDTQARSWALDHGSLQAECPAPWGLFERWGRKREAGTARNKGMVWVSVQLRGLAEVHVLALPGPESRGTYHCAEMARSKGLAVTQLGALGGRGA